MKEREKEREERSELGDCVNNEEPDGGRDTERGRGSVCGRERECVSEKERLCVIFSRL